MRAFRFRRPSASLAWGGPFLLVLGARLALGDPAPAPLPQPPPGVEVATLFAFGDRDQEPVRIAAHPDSGTLYVLGGGGDLTRIDVAARAGKLLLHGSDYIDEPNRPDVNIPLPVDATLVNAPIRLRATLCLGLAFDRERRLYIVANVLIPGPIDINRVVLYRTAPISEAAPFPRPQAWTVFQYPYGLGGFNHGACRIAQGPDGRIYLGSGSRTDHGERGDQPRTSRLGEGPHPNVPGGPGFPGGDFTASILRFDPTRGQQVPDVCSRGNRNPFGFDWDDRGRLIDAEHGPMADHPEELNLIEAGKHYGFPYVFGDGELPSYPDRLAPPSGLTFVPPLRNEGPAGLLGVTPMSSLAPHSAPGGLVFYRSGTLPARYQGSFFLARFGNLVAYNRIGFDVLNLRLVDRPPPLHVVAERFLAPLARPIDLAVSRGNLYLLEYGRQSETVGPRSSGFAAAGRVLEVTGHPAPSDRPLNPPSP